MNRRKDYMKRMVYAVTKAHTIGAAQGFSAVDRLVLATVNAPYKRDISVAALKECIAEAKVDVWPVHVATFFTDVDPFLIFRFATTHGISKSELAKAYMAMKATTGEHNPELETELAPLASSPR